ncbi:MAG: hypothetical protein Q9171_001392 [Xanthocarpia ochracea]
MDKAIAQALNSLIPEWNNALPEELIELAASLLAQSRNRASSLRAEEEIARTYACAHLACERLKQKIGLPKIHPRPPCPPKVYQKLYRHLDSALLAGARRTTRALKPVESAKSTIIPSTTPRTPNAYPAGRGRKREFVISEEVPSWAMKAIRGLCKHVDAPAATPHVFAGVSSILTLPPPNQESMTDNDLERIRTLSIGSLLVAVYLLVRTRLSGVQTESHTFSEKRDEALTVLSQMRNDGETVTAVDPTSVNDWMREIGRGRWTELDWFANVGEGAGLGLDDDRADHVNESDRGDSDEDEASLHRKRDGHGKGFEKPYLQPGLGTMMQDRVDYLSEEKRADYQTWKKDFLARLNRMEKAERDQKPVGQ